jgi:2'-5' RNA ligase
MTQSAAEDQVTEIRNHWWWRPGWRLGRHFYACHLTFEGQTALHQLVSEYQAALSGFINLDLIPREWLHLTLRGIGFADEITQEQLGALRVVLTESLGEVPPIEVTFSQPVIRPEAIYLSAQPPERLRELHAIVGNAIRLVLGDNHEPPEAESTYTPHVSIAYANADGPTAPIRDALASVTAPAAQVLITELPILTFNRDHRMYQWTSRTPIRLGGE